jgi:two-component system, NtrC family, nitrogen regulation sensor histidine kinase NtrY
MRSRTPFRNNARLILATVGGLLLLLGGLQLVLRASGAFTPDFLTSVLLSSFTALNLAVFFVLLLYLGRNVVRAVMEWRRGVLGARFRLRLLLLFLVMAIGPALLVVLVGSDVIRHTVDRWFNVDVERMLSSSQVLGTALRESLRARARVHARTLAHEIASRGLLESEGQSRLHRLVDLRARQLELDAVQVVNPRGVLVEIVSPRLSRAAIDPLSEESLVGRALSGEESDSVVPLTMGELIRVAVPAGERTARGAVIVSSLLPSEVARSSHEIENGYVKFQQTKMKKEPIKALYVALFLLPALLVLFGGGWLALYVASRITTPLRLVALGAERIAAGERGVRVDFPTGSDEFGALIGSFNKMSERLARSEEELEFSREGLARKNQELETRQRLMEAVLETIGAGVLVVDKSGALATINSAACRLLELEPQAAGRPLAQVFEGAGRETVAEMVQRLLSGRVERQQGEVAFAAHDGERHLAVTVVALASARGEAPDAVVIVEDLTPLIRAQRVAAWGEVARKLAHEIKNPLTPIQLSAQRVRKAFLRQAPDFEKVLTESTRAIVAEVEALRTLVDEFAHFARLPAAQPVPTALAELIDQTLMLYDGLFRDVRFERRYAPDLPRVRVDPQQIKRVLINLIDNAVDALAKRGTIEVATEVDADAGRVRLIVADDGPGIPAAARAQLFVPSFSTKRRGSGLGLAVVSRIVQEHQGTIRVEANQPKGARFVLEFPL